MLIWWYAFSYIAGVRPVQRLASSFLPRSALDTFDELSVDWVTLFGNTRTMSSRDKVRIETLFFRFTLFSGHSGAIVAATIARDGWELETLFLEPLLFMLSSLLWNLRVSCLDATLRGWSSRDLAIINMSPRLLFRIRKHARVTFHLCVDPMCRGLLLFWAHFLDTA